MSIADLEQKLPIRQWVRILSLPPLNVDADQRGSDAVR